MKTTRQRAGLPATGGADVGYSPIGAEHQADSPTGRPEIRCGVVPAEAQGTWDDFVTGSSAGHMHQCFWWATPVRPYGMSPEVVAAWSGDDLLGGTLFRCTN